MLSDSRWPLKLVLRLTLLYLLIHLYSTGVVDGMEVTLCARYLSKSQRALLFKMVHFVKVVVVFVVFKGLETTKFLLKLIHPVINLIFMKAGTRKESVSGFWGFGEIGRAHV